MKRWGLLLLCLFVICSLFCYLSLAKKALANDCFIAYRATDWTCMRDCQSFNYSWRYCKSACSYETGY